MVEHPPLTAAARAVLRSMAASAKFMFMVMPRSRSVPMLAVLDLAAGEPLAVPPL